VSDERDERGGRRGSADAWRFVDWVARRGRRSPETTAVVDARSGERLTYAALDRAVERTAGRLAALGVTEGDHLGAVVGTRLAAARVVHAAARLGGMTPARRRYQRSSRSSRNCGLSGSDMARATSRPGHGSSL